MTQKPLLIEMPIKINFYDIDAMGIVSNIVYVRWLEDLRTKFLDVYFPLPDLLKEGITPILRETHVDYKRPLTIFDQPKGQLWISELHRGRWVIEQEIYCGDKLHCKALQRGYFVNLQTKRPVPVPEKLQKDFDDFFADKKDFA